MVLVVGSTGHVGSAVCRLIVEDGKPVRALVRSSSDPERLEALRAAGVELARGDLREPATLESALAGVHTVVSTATAIAAPTADNRLDNVDADGHAALVDAARQAGVRHFIFVSFSGGLEIDTPLRSAKRGTERLLRESGMHFTILRPTAFMEIWLTPLVGFDPAAGNAVVFGSGAEPISYISAADVARICAMCVDNPAVHDRTIEIGGPEAVAPLEAVRIAEELAGQSIAVQHVPREALRAQYEAATDPVQKTMAGLPYAFADGDVIDSAASLPEFPIAMRTVREHIAQLVRAPATTPPPAA